nr:immunoglobulin light chain junction region [Macaca mulatta]MOV79189.1 immunoglobulin light chain junction region [Macaca mulatta]MOV82253.1 immunoglobulin light chain junction region [Macaca mulatta]MOV84708.1 immunoglobulin light chain junction region [Macaca mulatta]
CQHYISSPFTF